MLLLPLSPPPVDFFEADQLYLPCTSALFILISFQQRTRHMFIIGPGVFKYDSVSFVFFRNMCQVLHRTMWCPSTYGYSTLEFEYIIMI